MLRLVTVFSLSILFPTNHLMASSYPTTADTPPSLPHAESYLFGKAFDKQTGELLYLEEHYKTNERQQLVLYKEPNGHLFAQKYLEFNHTKITPNVHQVNFRNGEVIKIRKQKAQFEVVYQENKNENPTNETISVTDSVVIDAGFHHFIVTHWASLQKGTTQQIEYLIPSRQTTIQLSIKKTPCKAATLTCFQVTTSNPIFRLLSDPLKLTYDTKTRQLTTFNGRSNISNSNGEYLDVVIHYHLTDR